MTSLRLLGGHEAFDALFEAIAGARSCVLLEMYIFAADATGAALRDRLTGAAGRGLEVRVLVDAWGSWSTPDSFWEPLRAAGAQVRAFRPIRRGLFPFRNHRKLVLVDDRTAFCGGMNVADEYRAGAGGRPPWKDFMLEVAGKEAAALRRQFLRMWVLAERPLPQRAFFRRPAPLKPDAGERVRFFASGPGERSRRGLLAYRQVLRAATGGIDLAMSYFFPPGRILRELRRAVRRGLRVRLLLPRRTDVPVMRWAARGLYGRLLRAGVEVWEYLPAMLHAKVAVAGDCVVAGSANLDLRSDRLNHELTVLVRDETLAGQARARFAELLGDAEAVDQDAWRRRPLLERIRERASYWIVARADLFLSRLEVMRSRW